VPRLLQGFAEKSIHATWAAVGFLFYNGRYALQAALPERLPSYADPRLSPYPEIELLGCNEAEDALHFAPSLLRQIARAPYQELGSHTFSHYYCTEPGQTAGQFRADMQAAVVAAQPYGQPLRSLVFPRNHFNAEYLQILAELGFSAYRGNPQAAIYRQGNPSHEPLSRRGLRLLDAYLPFTGSGAFDWPQADAGTSLVNVRASRFLRPFTPQEGALARLRLRNIKSAMTKAAQRGQVYHLWWHPHNMGLHTELNLEMLDEILGHYAALAQSEGMLSLSMGEVAEIVRVQVRR